MANKYPPNVKWIEERLEELVALIESYGFSALINRKASYFQSVYVTVYVPSLTRDSRPINKPKMLKSCMQFRVADHPPRHGRFGMEQSIHPGSESVATIFGREKRAWRKRQQTRANERAKVIQGVGKPSRRK